MLAATELFLALTENLVLSYAIGIPSLLKSDGSRRRILAVGFLTACYIVVGCMMTALIRPLLPVEYARVFLPLFSAVINGILDLLLLCLIAVLPLRKPDGIIMLLHMSAFSSAVLGAILLCYEQKPAFSSAFSFGLRCGFGYLLACLMLCCAAPALCSRKMPAAMRGWRGMLLYIGILSMAAACISAGNAPT